MFLYFASLQRKALLDLLMLILFLQNVVPDENHAEMFFAVKLQFQV